MTGPGRAADRAGLTPRRVLDLTPFASLVGIEFDRLDPAEVTATLPWHPSRCTVGGVLHGGALTTLGDAVAGVCAYLNLDDDAIGTATAELKVDFLHPVRGGTVTAAARPLSVEPRFVMVRADLHDDAGTPVARVVQRQVTIR